MESISTIGLEIAKSVFQVHGVDAAGQVVVRRQLRRRHVLAFFQKLPPCLVGIEACASSHHWSRELQALGPGPDPRRASWPAVMSTAQTGRTHGCFDHCCKVRFSLPTRSRPHMALPGPSAMSAFAPL